MDEDSDQKDGRTVPGALIRLARACGIAARFENWGGTIVNAPPVTLVRLINTLYDFRLPDRPSPAALRRCMKEVVRRRRHPDAPGVIVAWGGALKSSWFWMNRCPGKLRAVLRAESGEKVAAPAIARVKFTRRGRLWRIKLCWKAMRIPGGYYRLDLFDGRNAICSRFLISAPQRVEDRKKSWGLFVPTYALQTESASGIGGFRELKEVAADVKRCGGGFIGTLPLLSTAYEGRSPDPSPYAPQSRLFWNEIFLDAGEHRRGVERAGLVDYGEAYSRKRKYLERSAERFFKAGRHKSPAFRAFLKSTPYLAEYAGFRAAREGGSAARFHQYVQYQCHRQLAGFRAQPDRYAELYLDYPVGVRRDGFDATHFGHLFIQGAQVGAPPDMFFAKGQDWGFQPVHPSRFIEDGFRYYRATLNNYFRYARMLRLDHIMGLYRLYCIPEGFSAEHGAYVHYPFEAFLAVLCLEAHRNGGLLAGEDLGTVPGVVRRAMTRHGISRMWVAQLEMKSSPERTFRAVRPNMIASLNTHDLFPFAGYMEGRDIDTMANLGVMDAAEARTQREARRKALKKWKGGEAALRAALVHLAASPARRVIVNVEDLWRETLPQNIPGTCGEYANWRRRLPFPAKSWQRRKGVRDAVKTLNRYRSGRGHR